jgi:hypothetical protein
MNPLTVTFNSGTLSTDRKLAVGVIADPQANAVQLLGDDAPLVGHGEAVSAYMLNRYPNLL